MELKIGDVLYEDNNYGGLRKVTILRTTPTQAITVDDIRFDIRQSHGHFIRAKGHHDSYNSPVYRIETHDLKEKYTHQQLVRQFETIKPKELSTDQLQRILSITKES